MSWKRCSVAATLCFLLVLVLPAVIQAHAELLHTEPAAGDALQSSPQEVRLFFSEPIEPEFFGVEVYAADGMRVDRQDARIAPEDVTILETPLPSLPPGPYSVRWRVLSIDGHVVRGTFRFSVGAAGSTTDAGPELPAVGAPFPLSAAVRTLTYWTAFVLVGGLAFLPLILWPALASSGVASLDAAKPATRGFLATAWLAITLLLLLSLGSLLLQAADVTGVALSEVLSGRAVTRLLTATRYGTFWIARLALLFGLLAVMVAISVEARPRLRTRWLGVVLGVGLFGTIAASGHASSVADRTALSIVADWLHLLAGALWVGGLLQLLLGLPSVLALLEEVQRRRVLARSVQRFSWLAGVSVAALVVTGLFTGLLHVPSWQALADTVYGAALSTKLLLVAPLLALGAVNLLVLHPRFVGSARNAAATASPASVGLFRRVVMGEIGLALLVLAVTGVLAGLPPATTAPGAGRPFRVTQQAGDVAVTLAVSPNVAGENRFEIELAGPDGQPYGSEGVMLVVQHSQMDMGQRELVPEPVAIGRYRASANVLNMAGTWEVDVGVRRTGANEQRATFQLSVGQAPSESVLVFSPLRILRYALTLRTAAGLLVLLLAAVVLQQRTTWRRARDRHRGALIGAALVLVGMFVTGNALASAYRASRPNPVPATEDSVARGQAIYTQNCASCHGFSGRGDGPAGLRLRPRPADFRVHMAAGHTDAQLYRWVSEGVDGTAMPAFRDALAREDIWNVINYIRTFGTSGRSGGSDK